MPRNGRKDSMGDGGCEVRGGLRGRSGAWRSLPLPGLAALVVLGLALGTGEMAARAAGAATFTGQWTRPEGGAGVPAASESNAAATYTAQYGFYTPGAPVAIAADEQARLAALIPFARAAAARVNARYGAHLLPQMLIWWTHAEGIRGRINYSNCANDHDQYLSHITNCVRPSFWQLGGMGDQFSYVGYLPLAIDDMYGAGESGDAALVQRLGQQVLDFDRQVGVTPACGGFSCTFPAQTVSQVLQGTSQSSQTTGNWYASLLMRDPGVGAWMTGRALRNFSHAQTQGWVGCYYAASCWQRLSDRLGDVLTTWPALVQLSQTQAALTPVRPAAPTAPPATAAPTQTPAPTAAPTGTPPAAGPLPATPAPTATPGSGSTGGGGIQIPPGWCDGPSPTAPHWVCWILQHPWWNN